MSETLARSLIRLIVTVGILAAVYFFMIRPILDTTNDTIDKAFDSFDGVESSLDNAFEDAGDQQPAEPDRRLEDGRRARPRLCQARSAGYDEDAAVRRALHRLAAD